MPKTFHRIVAVLLIPALLNGVGPFAGSPVRPVNGRTGTPVNEKTVFISQALSPSVTTAHCRILTASVLVGTLVIAAGVLYGQRVQPSKEMLVGAWWGFITLVTAMAAGGPPGAGFGRTVPPTGEEMTKLSQIQTAAGFLFDSEDYRKLLADLEFSHQGLPAILGERLKIINSLLIDMGFDDAYRFQDGQDGRLYDRHRFIVAHHQRFGSAMAIDEMRAWWTELKEKRAVFPRELLLNTIAGFRGEFLLSELRTTYEEYGYEELSGKEIRFLQAESFEFAPRTRQISSLARKIAEAPRIDNYEELYRVMMPETKTWSAKHKRLVARERVAKIRKWIAESLKNKQERGNASAGGVLSTIYDTDSAKRLTDKIHQWQKVKDSDFEEAAIRLAEAKAIARDEVPVEDRELQPARDIAHFIDAAVHRAQLDLASMDAEKFIENLATPDFKAVWSAVVLTFIGQHGSKFMGAKGGKWDWHEDKAFVEEARSRILLRFDPYLPILLAAYHAGWSTFDLGIYASAFDSALAAVEKAFAERHGTENEQELDKLDGLLGMMPDDLYDRSSFDQGGAYDFDPKSLVPLFQKLGKPDGPKAVQQLAAAALDRRQVRLAAQRFEATVHYAALALTVNDPTVHDNAWRLMQALMSVDGTWILQESRYSSYRPSAVEHLFDEVLQIVASPWGVREPGLRRDLQDLYPGAEPVDFTKRFHLGRALLRNLVQPSRNARGFLARRLKNIAPGQDPVNQELLDELDARLNPPPQPAVEHRMAQIKEGRERAQQTEKSGRKRGPHQGPGTRAFILFVILGTISTLVRAEGMPIMDAIALRDVILLAQNRGAPKNSQEKMVVITQPREKTPGAIRFLETAS